MSVCGNCNTGCVCGIADPRDAEIAALRTKLAEAEAALAKAQEALVPLALQDCDSWGCVHSREEAAAVCWPRLAREVLAPLALTIPSAGRAERGGGVHSLPCCPWCGEPEECWPETGLGGGADSAEFECGSCSRNYKVRMFTEVTFATWSAQ